MNNVLKNQQMSFLERWKDWGGQLKLETYALYLAYRDPGVPWYAKVFALCVVGYALSPIDLIPDFIPILGYLDDLIIIPFGITIALKMIPGEVLERCREKARMEMSQDKPKFWLAAGVIVAIWLLALALVIAVIIRII